MDLLSTIKSALKKTREKLPDDLIDELTAMIHSKLPTCNMKRWRVLLLEWDNMMKYACGNSIDFTSLGNISAIIAPNDSGKSSVVDILVFSLYGDAIRASKNTIERIGKNKSDRSWTSVWIQVYSGDLYKIDREIRDGRTTFLKVYAAPSTSDIKDALWCLQEWGTIPQTQRQLQSIIGDVEMFKNTSLIAAGDVNITNCEYTDRFRLISHICGFSEILAVPEVNKELINRRSSISGELRGLLYAQPVDSAMPASEIEWMEEKFSGIDTAELTVQLRAQLSNVKTRDTFVVHEEYEKTITALRDALNNTPIEYVWNQECGACSHNRSLHSVDHELVERLSTKRDILAAEYKRSREIDYLRLELAYAEKHAAWKICSRISSAARVRIDELNEEIADIDRIIAVHDLYREVIKDGVVAGAICDWHIRRIIEIANKILGYMQCDFSLSFEIVNSNGLKLTACRPGHYRIPLELGGSYQRFACGLAIRAAVARCGGGPDIIIVDEGFDCMDHVNRYKCIDALPKISKLFSNFIVISQIDALTNTIQTKLVINSSAAGSILRNTPRQISAPDTAGRKKRK